jgi:hypothetical protein
MIRTRDELWGGVFRRVCLAKACSYTTFLQSIPGAYFQDFSKEKVEIGFGSYLPTPKIFIFYIITTPKIFYFPHFRKNNLHAHIISSLYEFDN